MHDYDVKNSSLSDSDAAKNETRLNLLYETGRILASTETIEEAAPQIIEVICRHLQFDVGEFWSLGENDTFLRRKSFWQQSSMVLEQTAADSGQLEFSIGEDLPGRVWQHGAPIWIEDLSGENGLSRFVSVERAKMRSAFAFPILLGEKFLGAFCFFRVRQSRQDEELSKMFVAVGGNIGHFIKRERVEKNLRESNAILQTINQSSPTLIYLKDRTGRMLNANPATLDVLGKTLTEVIGQTHSEFTKDAAEGEIIAENDRRIIERGETETFEEEVLTKGTRHTFLSTKTPYRNECGEIIGLVGVSFDITEHRRAKEELRDSEERFRTMADNAPVMIWVTDANGYCNYLSQSWYRFTGQTPETGLGFGWLDATHPDDLAVAEKAFLEANERREAFRVEYRLRGTDGSYIWAIDSAQPRFDQDGKFLGYIGSVIDITERKAAEEALRASEQRYRSLFETMDEGFCRCEMIFDVHGKPCDYRFLEVNPVFEKMTGLENAAGKTALELIPNLESHWLETYGRVVLTGESIRFTDGSEAMSRWFDVYASRIGDENSREFALLFTDISERRKIETERERFLAVGSDLQTVSEVGADCFKWVNPAWERSLGWTVEEMTSQPWHSLVHPDDHAKSVRLAKKIHTGRETDWFENRYRHKDGSYRRLSWRTKTYIAENLIYAVAVDITERRRVEETLRESQEVLSLAMSSSRMGVWSRDLTNETVYWSAELEEIFGLAEGTFSGNINGFYDYVYDEDKESVAREVRNALDEHRDYVVEFRFRHADGSLRWMEGRGQAIYGDDGKPVKVYGIGIEITERKRAEADLRESEDKFRNLANSISQLAWIADEAGHIFWYNERWFEYTGTTLGDMEGWGWQKVHHPEEVRRVTEKFQFHLSSGEIWEDTFPIRSKSGEYRWFLSRALPIRDENNQIVRWFGTNTDITERREIEAERERLLESEHRAREIAEQANYAKDEFIALVSHELRSPLNAMLGWTRILQNQKTDEKTTDHALDVIVRNALSQSRLIEDLLDIARIGKGKLRLELAPIELAPIINNAVEITKPTADSKNIRLSQTFERTANLITGDGDRLRQVVENLLANAVKFTPDGGSVSVRLEREDSQAKIIVSDNGQGISAEFLPQIFERFKQADPSTTRRHGGLGIGLSLARDLVELHGGTISAESAGEGEGSTFIVRLPLRSLRPIKDITGKVENMDSQGKLSGFWILAVDDEADAREIISFMLQINGARVTSANSAVEALEILKNANDRIPDILLSDISMPNESGYALLEKIRSLPREHGGQIPAVALTAFNRPEDREAAFEAGFQKHLGKPVDMDALIDAIVETANAKHA